jgi:hypothetical protein
MASIPASRPPADTFDARAWLTAWTENGGIYFVIDEMLHLRRSVSVDHVATSNLDQLRDNLLRAGGGPAIADAVMDRIIHNSYILALDSKQSMREVMAKKNAATG